MFGFTNQEIAGFLAVIAFLRYLVKSQNSGEAIMFVACAYFFVK